MSYSKPVPVALTIIKHTPLKHFVLSYVTGKKKK